MSKDFKNFLFQKYPGIKIISKNGKIEVNATNCRCYQKSRCYQKILTDLYFYYKGKQNG